MSITHWSTHERPRERLIQHGPATLSEAELLAVLWERGTRGHNALNLAHTLLQHCGGLVSLCERNYLELSQYPSIGASKYCQLQAALELSRRYWRAPVLLQPITLHNGLAVAQFLLTHLRNASQEVFAALFLDNKHRLIQFEKLFFGTIHSATVHPRIVVKRALAHNAAAVIVAHNHPSGTTEASQADREITEQLRKALALIDVELLDHLIIGANTVGGVCLTESFVSGIKSDLF